MQLRDHVGIIMTITLHTHSYMHTVSLYYVHRYVSTICIILYIHDNASCIHTHTPWLAIKEQGRQLPHNYYTYLYYYKMQSYYGCPKQGYNAID